MKPANLLSLVNANKDLSSSVFELFLRSFDIEIKENELTDLESLVNELYADSEGPEIFDDFYVGYTIDQISKEFDLLRFGKTSIINIELKRENTGDRIKEQLKKNKYYLSFLGKKVISFTYVSQDKKLFYFDETESLKETDYSFLISLLIDQKPEYIEDINKLFDPSNYLVSPFNSTIAFMENRYFLTDHQENIKKEILKLIPKTGPCFITIEGNAGTGKTLLTYDIAKEYINNTKNVLIFHCGTLNGGHHKLREDYSWTIAAIKNYRSYDVSNYELIIVDETQRIYQYQLDELLEKIKKTNVKCIFSYDSQQCLARWEIKGNIPQYIKSQVSPQAFKLTEKIRTNKEIASFIKNLFDLSKKNPNQKYTNVDVQYFSNVNDSREYLEVLKNQKWKIINYTPSMYKNYPYEKYQNRSNDTAHKVIGQEYDNVVAVLDKHFYYNKDGKLDTKGYSETPYYHPTKMLFQIVTRARKRLRIIIINNEAMLNQCLKILQPK